MFEQIEGIRVLFNKILDTCDEICEENIPNKLIEIRNLCATGKLELEELEFQSDEEA